MVSTAAHGRSKANSLFRAFPFDLIPEKPAPLDQAVFIQV